MSNDSFREPFLKIGRAKHHIADLDRKISSYLSKRPLVLTVAQYPEIAQRQYLIEAKEPIPDEFALVIGDAIHNLRSALDIMMVALVAPFATYPEGISFPFCKDAKSLKDTIARCQIHLAGAKVVAAIEGLQPYPTGDKDLHGLHELDIRDKHRLIVPVGRNAELTDAEFKQLEPSLLAGHEPVGAKIILAGFGDARHPIVFRINIAYVPMAQIQRFKGPAEVQPTFTICFDQGQPFAHEPVIPTMMLLTRKVENAVNSIKAATI